MNINPAHLGHWIGTSIAELLTEQNAPIVVLPGRFQPFHIGHFKSYQELVKKFGENNVYIVTSNKTNENSPFSFDEKQKIISKMFGIDPTKIIQTKNPYSPVEIAQTLDPDTPMVYAVGEKDADRLSHGTYFTSYRPGEPMQSFTNKGYVEILPNIQQGNRVVNASDIRSTFAGSDEGKKKQLFTQMYGRLDPEIFDLMNQKISQASVQAQPTTPTSRADALARDQFLRARIVNPMTKKQILVRTALTYPLDHPAHKLARRLMKARGLIEDKLLSEGGAAGHMMHPYENMQLTFRDLKEMARRALVGGLDKEGKVSEKIDGMNIMFTVVDGKVKFARNKGHLQNNAQSALTADEIKMKFMGRGGVETAFSSAVEDLEVALSKLSPERLKMFGDGSKFMNLEIIHPQTRNIIPYDKSVLIFHNMIEFDDSGKAIGQVSGGDEEIVKALQEINADKQKTFGIQTGGFVIFSDSDKKKYEKLAQHYMDEYDFIAKENNLTDENTIGDYLAAEWSSQLDEQGIVLSDAEKEILIRRWVYGDKSVRLSQLETPFKDEIKAIDNVSKYTNDLFLRDIVVTTLQLGADTISRITDVLSSNNPAHADELRALVKRAQEKIMASSDNDKIDQIETQLAILNSVGQDKIQSSEGIVFNYGGGIYKLTGAFAPLNRILNTAAQSDMGTSPQRTTFPAEKPIQRPGDPYSEKPRIRGNRAVLLQKTILNPVTRNNIKVQTALTYPPDHPAHKAARAMLGES